MATPTFIIHDLSSNEFYCSENGSHKWVDNPSNASEFTSVTLAEQHIITNNLADNETRILVVK